MMFMKLLNATTVVIGAPILTVDPVNGIRVVSAKGKPAFSGFRFLRYNAVTNSSLVACYPISGRPHQLRVHLQWLGFPVYGDVQYGGPSWSCDSLVPVARSLVANSQATTDEVLSSHVSMHDASLARTACRLCQGRNGEGNIDVFRRGRIKLHAVKYEISLDNLGALQLEVPLPDWAEDLDDELLKWPECLGETRKKLQQGGSF